MTLSHTKNHVLLVMCYLSTTDRQTEIANFTLNKPRVRSSENLHEIKSLQSTLVVQALSVVSLHFLKKNYCRNKVIS